MAPAGSGPHVTVALAGDTMLGRGVAAALEVLPPESLFAPEVVAAVRGADLALLNLECCISTRGARWPDPAKPFFFRAPPAAVQALSLLGLDCITLANNHALDFGYAALIDTLDLLHAAGISTVGAGTNVEEARRPAILEACGFRRASSASRTTPRRTLPDRSGPEWPSSGWAPPCRTGSSTRSRVLRRTRCS
jgi:poly-gamma-glutamate synthesis protein (capsule biosynthesis protein)